MKVSKITIFVLLALILLAGFSFRVYQLGADSFWNDEVSQFEAASQPNISEVFLSVKKHVMAFPMDYLATRLMINLGTSELLLRIPSLIWSVLAMVVFYLLAKTLTDTWVALAATWLLAISPIHIQYAQEMRFYAALVFFYLLSTFILVLALKKPSLKLWGVYILSTTLGAYFHPYVLLSLLNGLFILLFEDFKHIFKDRKLWQLVGAGMICAVLFLPGYLYFGAAQQFSHDLLKFSNSIFQVIFVGLGWEVLKYTPDTAAIGLQFGMYAAFAIIGLILALRRLDKYSSLIGIILASLLQIGLIILANAYKGYYVLPRQFQQLAPFFMVLSSLGVIGLVRKLKLPKSMQIITGGIILSLFLVATFPHIQQYYADPKANLKQIALELIDLSETGDKVLVIPGNEAHLYRVYEELLTGEIPAAEFQKTDWESLGADIEKNTKGDIFLITPVTNSIPQIEQIENLGFQLVYEPESPVGGLRALYLLQTQ